MRSAAIAIHRLLAALVAVAALFAFVSRARADDKPTLSGSWSATAMSETWAIGDWGEACGPRPAPHGAGGGGVQIKQNGNELSMSGAGRGFSTTECWEQMPGLGRTSHSASGGARFWRTRCNTPSNDPRQATVIMTINATDTTISMTETGQYQFVIQGTNCTASVTRSRSLSLVHREGEEAPAASATATASARTPPPEAKTATPKADHCSGPPGEPARFEVHPGKKLLRAGDHFIFRAVVLDGEGCVIPTHPLWSIAPGPLASKASVDTNGALTIAADAEEGRLDLSVAAFGKTVAVPVQVASSSNYDALLVNDYNDAGESDEAAFVVIATGTIGGRAGVGEDLARQRKYVFVTIVGAIALFLAFVALVIVRRGKGHARPADAGGSEEAGARESAYSTGPDEPVSQSSAQASPRAGERERARSVPKGKICPTCGDHYPAEAEYCGKDATKLVPLN